VSALASKLAATASRRELKTLVIDVERLQGKAEVPFWGLSDYKHRRISHEHVTEWPRTFLACWRWIGEKKIHAAAEWDEGGAAAFAQKVRDELHRADIITGHYVNNADRKWLNSLFRDHGIDWPSPVKVIDTCTIARRDLGDESMTLAALCKRFGIPTKTGKYSAEMAQAACAGDVKAQREMTAYCKGDVEASTGLYFHTLPLAHNHPHVAPMRGMDEPTCPRCASTNVKRDGSWSPGVYVYARYRCDDCPGTSYFRTVYEGRGPAVRAL
jgi:hypothetical protein